MEMKDILERLDAIERNIRTCEGDPESEVAALKLDIEIDLRRQGVELVKV